MLSKGFKGLSLKLRYVYIKSKLYINYIKVEKSLKTLESIVVCF